MITDWKLIFDGNLSHTLFKRGGGERYFQIFLLRIWVICSHHMLRLPIIIIFFQIYYIISLQLYRFHQKCLHLNIVNIVPLQENINLYNEKLSSHYWRILKKNCQYIFSGKVIPVTNQNLINFFANVFFFRKCLNLMVTR